MATLLPTDIVDSTVTAVRLGDRAWRELLARHGDRTRLELDRFRGHEIATTGDGFPAMFDGASRAVRCGEAAGHHGLRIRAGVHSGEVELRAGNVSGVAVHATARIAALAAAGEVLVSASAAGLPREQASRSMTPASTSSRACRLYRLAGTAG